MPPLPHPGSLAAACAVAATANKFLFTGGLRAKVEVGGLGGAEVGDLSAVDSLLLTGASNGADVGGDSGAEVGASAGAEVGEKPSGALLTASRPPC